MTGLQGSAPATGRRFRSTLLQGKLVVMITLYGHIHNTIKHGIYSLMRFGTALHAAARIQLLRHFLGLQFTL